MKRYVLLILAVIFSLSMMSCSKVPAGNVGIKFYLLGKDKGVDYDVLTPGRYWIGINEELYLFPTFTQNYVWTQNKTEGSENDESITFQTKEGLTVNADVGITYHINPSFVPKIFQMYKRGINEITDVFLRNMVRDAFVQAASNNEIEYLYGIGKTELLKDVERIVKSQVDSIGIVIDKIYLIGNMRLPKTVVEALNRKIEAKQRAQQRENELREAEAQAAKKVAEAEGKAKSILVEAKAQAEANRILAKSLTKELVQYKSIEKWSGKLPTYTGGGAIPFINIK